MREGVYTISPSLDSTLAIEITKTGLAKRKKHLLFFERFSGELCHVPDEMRRSCVKLTIDAASVVCRDKWLKLKRQKRVTRCARDEVLATHLHPHITFASTRVCPKPIRGFTVEGALQVRGITRTVTANVVLSETKQNNLQIDGDAVLRLSDFNIRWPSSFFGLSGSKDEALLRLLLWGTRSP